MFRRVKRAPPLHMGPRGEGTQKGGTQQSSESDTGFRFFFLFIYYRGRTVVGTLGTGSGALVTRVARDTHDCGVCLQIFKRQRISSEKTGREGDSLPTKF
jgi:hypothetical protein